MRRGRILLVLTLLLTAVGARSESFFDDLNYFARIGYSVGGTIPTSIPRTVRELSEYNLQANFTLAVDVQKPLGKRWGVMLGLHYENRGMGADVRVKSQYMHMIQGGESLEGLFTGHAEVTADQNLITIPIEVTYEISSKVRVRLGPTISYVFTQDFHGQAYDGYLRVDDPTGAKVEVGTDDLTRGHYDFSDDLRDLQVAALLGFDWQFAGHWGAYTELSWGLNAAFRSHFKTIKQTLYPIYGTIGCIYKL